MRKLFLIGCVLLFTGCSIFPKGGQENSGIDRNEFAELVIGKDIRNLVDGWSTRVQVVVSIFEKDKAIVITITNANGEDFIQDTRLYKNLVQPMMENSVKKFDWLKEYKLTFQIL